MAATRFRSMMRRWKVSICRACLALAMGAGLQSLSCPSVWFVYPPNDPRSETNPGDPNTYTTVPCRAITLVTETDADAGHYYWFVDPCDGFDPCAAIECDGSSPTTDGPSVRFRAPNARHERYIIRVLFQATEPTDYLDANATADQAINVLLCSELDMDGWSGWPLPSPDNDPCSPNSVWLMPLASNGAYVILHTSDPSAQFDPQVRAGWFELSGGEPNGPDGPNTARRVRVWEPRRETVKVRMGCDSRSKTIKAVRVLQPLQISGADPSPREPNDPNDRWYFAGCRADANECVNFAASLDVACEPNEARVVLAWTGATADPNDHRRAFVSKGSPCQMQVAGSCAYAARLNLGIIQLTNLAVEGNGLGFIDNEWVMGIRNQGEYVTVSAWILPNDADPYLFPSGFVEWSAGQSPNDANDQLHRLVSASAPAETDMTCRIGDSNDHEVIKVVTLQELAGGGGSASQEDPNVRKMVMCCPDDANELLRVHAVLLPDCTDAQARHVLTWSGDAEVDPEAPNDHTRRVLRVGTPGKKTVTARVGVRSETLEVLVLKVQWMTVSAHSASGRSRTNPPDANDLYVPEEPNSHSAKVDLSVSVIPEEGKGYVRWSVGGDAADPFTGTASDLPKTITLTPTSGNRTFTFDVGADTDGDGENDCDCIGLTVNVVGVDVRVDSNNDGQIDDSDDEIEANAPGKVLALNNDTDNGDANTPDYQVPAGPISGEDDLVPAYLSVLGAPEDEGRWSLSFSSRVRVYLSASKTGRISADNWAPRSTMPSVVYVEGISQSGGPGDASISLSYELPDLPTTVITDTAALTVATVEFTNITLPNGFLGTLDDDPNLSDWSRGIRQEARNTIRVQYQIVPSADITCQTSTVSLEYRGNLWTGSGLVAGARLALCSSDDLPGASGTLGPPEPVSVVLDFPQDPGDPCSAGIRPTQGGGRYLLTLESSGPGIRFRSVPYEVDAKALVYGFHIEPNDPNGFCPYTDTHECPRDPELQGMGVASECYWGARLVYKLNAYLVGYDATGSVEDILRGDHQGMDIEVVADTVTRLRSVRSQKVRTLLDEKLFVKYEGYTSRVGNVPGGEPLFWGSTDTGRTTGNNASDYPAWLFVPGEVIAETAEGQHHHINVTATATMLEPNQTGCVQVYRRWDVPFRVRYDMVSP